ncbi:hypothetical protein [Microbacterium sp. GXF7504]
MTGPEQPTATPQSDSSKLVRWAIWVAIGALIAAAIVSVVWVLIGSQNDIIGRAFITIFLLAGFAGAAILEAHLAPRRPDWFTLLSMTSWVLALLIGAFLTWAPAGYDSYGFEGITRLLSFLLIVLILQLTVLHIRLYTKAMAHRPTTFNRTVGYITLGLVVLLAVMLISPLMLHEWVSFHDIYWRVVVAVTILAALGTALVPLVNLLFAPRRPRPVVAAAPAWPTYADGVTPLPVLPDGTPDWNAYYTGYPTYAAPTHAPSPTAQAAYAPHPSDGPVITPSEPAVHPDAAAPQPDAAPQQPGTPSGYEGYPPPPPLPPRP